MYFPPAINVIGINVGTHESELSRGKIFKQQAVPIYGHINLKSNFTPFEMF
jgi:hypothetical protein